jgi:hypothetical protein
MSRIPLTELGDVGPVAREFNVGFTIDGSHANASRFRSVRWPANQII